MKLGKIRLLAAALCMLAAMPAKTPGAVLVYEGDTDYDDSEEDGDTRWSYSRSDVISGPGVVDEEETKSQGPTVRTVTMGEQYHEAFGVYEESINNLYFLYANVSNGGITDRPVTIDIPANISYSMEKDGVVIPYASNQAVGERGTYVLRLSVILDSNAPLSKQEEYRATFRFRIQEKLPEHLVRNESGEPVDEIVVNGSGSARWNQSQSSAATRTALEIDEEGNEIKAAGEEKGRSEASETEAEKDETGRKEEEGEKNGESQENEGEAKEDEEVNETEASGQEPEEGEEAEGEDTDGIHTKGDGQEAGNGFGERNFTGGIREQVYVPSRKSYLVTMNNGRELVSNVPAGYIGPGSVEIVIPEGEACELYRNDEQIEYIPGNSLMDSGVYRVSLDGNEFTFAIASDVNRMELYPAPLGMRFTKGTLNGEELSLNTDRYVYMGQEGNYVFVLEGTEGQQMEFGLKKDTTAPEASVTIEGGTATIQYLSDDISRITLEKDGTVVEGFSGYQVDTPGSYRLTVADSAGNQGVASFTLKYSVNKYGIAAVILLVLALAGIVAYVIHVKKTIKIR